ncbi:MAG: outer membrane beta-barrel protein [Flavobacterium sp.]|uniref:outer membrane beta-barrel protein n=1 Tax=Flavobacterium sp. TaxID=239 RepID=UPI0032646F09
MKKTILGLAIFTVFFTQNINAQESITSGGSKGLYFKINGGYNFAVTNSQHGVGETPFAPSPYPFYDGSVINGGSDINWKTADVNLGKGINFGGTIGYMFNNQLGAEIAVDYLLGSKTETKIDGSGGSLNQTLSSRMIQIKPSFVLSAGYSKINPYAKFGAIIGSGKITQEFNLFIGDLTEVEAEAKGGLAFGFHAGVGLNFGLTPKLSLFGELNMNNLSYAPEEGKLTKYNVNGVDQLPTLDISVKEYQYTDENPYIIIGGGGTSPDPNQPYRAPKTSYSYSTIGINFGLKYSL